MGYVTDNQTPLEAPLAAAESGYAATSPTTGAQIEATALEYSPVRRLTEEAELGMYAGSSGTAQGMLAAINQDDFGNQLDSTLVPGGIKTPVLSADEINTKYAPTGPDGQPVKITDAPMAEGVAKLVGQAKAREIQRQGVIARYENAHSWPVNFATGTAGFLMDPLNLATAFVPGFGEEATAAALGRGLLARTAGRIVAGATGGAIAQVPLAVVSGMTAADEHSDYGLRDALRDTLFSASANALFHAGIGGGLRELGIFKPDEIMRQAKAPRIEGITPKPEAAPVSPAAQGGVRPETVPIGETGAPEFDLGEEIGEEPQASPELDAAVQSVANASADTKYAKMKAMIAQVADGREGNIEPIAGQNPSPVWLSKDEMMARGSDGYLNRAQEALIPVEKVTGREPTPAGEYVSGRAITQPIEVQYQPENDTYILYSGNHRVTQAEANGEAMIRAFVEPEHGKEIGDAARPVNTRQPIATPAQIAAQQAALYRNGFDQSLAHPEYAALDQAIYGEKQAAPLTEADQRLALAQNDMKAFEESGGRIRPEDRAEIDAANADIAKADDLDSAASEAAGCLGKAA